VCGVSEGVTRGGSRGWCRRLGNLAARCKALVVATSRLGWQASSVGGQATAILGDTAASLPRFGHHNLQPTYYSKQARAKAATRLPHETIFSTLTHFKSYNVHQIIQLLVLNF
jgi:hypothetical protein